MSIIRRFLGTLPSSWGRQTWWVGAALKLTKWDSSQVACSASVSPCALNKNILALVYREIHFYSCFFLFSELNKRFGRQCKMLGLHTRNLSPSERLGLRLLQREPTSVPAADATWSCVRTRPVQSALGPLASWEHTSTSGLSTQSAEGAGGVPRSAFKGLFQVLVLFIDVYLV